MYVDFLTPEQYTAETTGDEVGLSEEAQRDDYDDYAGQLRALGVASGELDLFEAFNSVADSGTLAFYDPRDEAAADWIERGALAVEMEAATILQIAARRGVAAACVLGVTDMPSLNGSRRMGPDELEQLGVRVGEAGYAALRSP